MSMSFRQQFKQLGAELKNIRDRLTRVEQSEADGGGGDPELRGKWHQRDHYGPETPVGDYHRSPAGLVIDPRESLQLEEATIDAEDDGTLIVRVYPFIDGDGGQGYNHGPLGEYRYDVSAGVQTISFEGLELEPLPDHYSGYVFSIDDSDTKLRRDSDATTPIDVEIATLSGASAASGRRFDSYFHFFNLKILSDRTDRPIYIDDGATTIEADATNRTLELKPPVSDWGAEMQDLVDRASPGDLIEFSPGSYISDTPVTVDKPLAILGKGCNSDLRDPTGPKIFPTGDFPLIETTPGVGIRAGGFHMVGEGVETGSAIITHGRSVINNLTGDRINDNLVHLHQSTHEDNLNSSRVWNVAGRAVGGAVVAATKTTSAKRELNALKIDVRMSFSCDYGINADSGFGNSYFIQQTEGTHKTALRMNTQRSLGWVQYAEGGTKPVIELLDGQNVGVIIHAGGSTSYEELWNLDEAANNNWFIQLTRHQDPYFYQNWSDIDVKGDFRIRDGELVMENEDGETFEYRPNEDGDLIRQ